jgi:hypothetical protein
MVFSYIFSLLKTGLFVVLLNDYFKRVHPEKYEDVIVTTTLKIIYLYSNFQLITNKAFRSVKQIILSNPRLAELLSEYRFKNKPIFEFVLDEKIIYSVNNEKINSLEFPKQYDFIIFSDYNNITSENHCVNKIILKTIPQNESVTYEVSDIKFMLIEVKINDKIIKINFKSDEYNYYIIDNIFDYKFFKYFLKIYHVNEIKDVNEELFNKMTIHILDNNVNKIEYDASDSLQLKKNEYLKLSNMIQCK